MFGCLKNLIKVGIVVLALIGFKTIGGFEWTHDMWVKYHESKDTQAEQEKAKDVADISRAGGEYKFVKNTSALGYNIVISEHNKTGQKFAILKNTTDGKDFFTQDDIEQGKMEYKLNEVTKKLKKQYIGINNLKILNDHGKQYETAGNIKLVQFEAGIENLPFKKIKGTVGVFSKKNSQDRILVSANVADSYSQELATEYFDKIFN